ncbi:MAG TPA: F0F1 ATP synthase subunit delta [Candidatus Dormibacteraeota bacterium]|nr:F0F1 ATP synthase subunit delta [Candidatus Dormibacteraeota bacterium]
MPEVATAPRVPSTARHYARAIFELAVGHGSFSAWSERLSRLRTLLDGSELGSALRSPEFSAAQRQELAQAVLARDSGIDKEAGNLLRLLIQSHRTAMLPSIQAGYNDLVDRAEGRVKARLSTAVEVSSDELQRFSKDLSVRLGMAVDFEAEVDPSLLGGAVVRVGDRVFDASLKTKLQQLRREMLTEAQPS